MGAGAVAGVAPGSPHPTRAALAAACRHLGRGVGEESGARRGGDDGDDGDDGDGALLPPWVPRGGS